MSNKWPFQSPKWKWPFDFHGNEIQMQCEKNKWITQHIGLIHFRNEGLAHIHGKRTAPQPFQSELLVDLINHTQNNRHVRYLLAQPIIHFINENTANNHHQECTLCCCYYTLVKFTLEHFPNSGTFLYWWLSYHPPIS